jgi:hypothetical protein
LRELIKYRVALSAGLAAVVVFGWALLVYLPTSARIRNCYEAVASLDQEVTSAQHFLTTAAQGLESSRWQKQRHEMLSSLYRVDSLEVFVDRLVTDLRQFGVNNPEIAPDLNELLKENRIPLGNTALIAGKFLVHCQARFLDLGRALENLEKQTYFVDVYSTTINGNDSSYPDVICDLNFGVYFRGKD